MWKKGISKEELAIKVPLKSFIITSLIVYCAFALKDIKILNFIISKYLEI
jgi:hypothetical protein